MQAFPILSRVALCVLAQPGAASAAERNWSVYGMIRHERRSHMRHEVGDKLVYCHEAIALHNKLSDAGFEIAKVPWDEVSDSDSDESNATDEGDAIEALLM